MKSSHPRCCHPSATPGLSLCWLLGAAKTIGVCFLTIDGELGTVRASLIVQLVKNPPAMQDTPVQFLGWEDQLEKGL